MYKSSTKQLVLKTYKNKDLKYFTNEIAVLNAFKRFKNKSANGSKYQRGFPEIHSVLEGE